MPEYGERALSYPAGTLAGARWKLATYQNPGTVADGDAALSVGSALDRSTTYPTYTALTGPIRALLAYIDPRTWDGLYKAPLLNTIPAHWRFTRGDDTVDWTGVGSTRVYRPGEPRSRGGVYVDYLWTVPTVTARVASDGAADGDADWTGAFLSFPTADTPSVHWVANVDSGGTVDLDDDTDAADAGTLATETATLRGRWHPRPPQPNGTLLWRGRRWRVTALRSGDRERTIEFDIARSNRLS